MGPLEIVFMIYLVALHIAGVLTVSGNRGKVVSKKYTNGLVNAAVVVGLIAIFGVVYLAIN